MISPGAAEVTYGGAEESAGTADINPAILAEALVVPESDVRLLGRHEGAARLRLGVALATASDVTTARDRVRQVSTALHRVWQP